MKTAIITGAGTGIGAAAAKRLSLNGWTVVLVGRRPDKLQETAAACKQGSTIVLADDLADPAAAARIVDKTLEATGRIDALINNAATIKVMPVTDYPLEQIDLLVSPDSAWVTGACIPMDGGQVLDIT